MKSKVKGDDYLKYIRVVRKWAYQRHGLTLPKLEMLLFLYSEGKFSRSDFEEYHQIFSWNTKWFERLREEGHIVKWRNQTRTQGALYCLSTKTVGIIKSIYRKLNGEEAISEYRGDMFGASPRFHQKVLRNYIKKINKDLREKG